MGFRRRLNKILRQFIIVNIIAIVLIFSSCKKSSSYKSENQKFNYTEYDTILYNDCSMYKMIFTDGRNSLRIALSGKCENLSNKEYLTDCKNFISKNENKISFKKDQYFRFEFYKELQMDSLKISEFIKDLEIITNKKILLTENWNEGFILMIE